MAAFRSKLFRYAGNEAAWTFAKIPERHAPPVTHGWGRTPVTATVDGQTWDTSVWRDKKYGTLLAVPKKIRGTKDDGDTVTIQLVPRGPLEVPDPPLPAKRARRQAR